MSINTNNKTNDGWHSVRDCYLSNNITKDEFTINKLTINKLAINVFTINNFYNK